MNHIRMKPRATYRLQFHKDFGFRAAAEIVPYLAQLGVSHLYASPWLKARPGSTHGYDIVDHHSLNPELGPQTDFKSLLAALKVNGMGQILDCVPNHMGVGGSDNPLWLNVLEWGPDSIWAGWFDIDWDSDRRYLRDKLLVPFLGDQYGAELSAGKLILKFDASEGAFAVWAYETHKLPICPLHYHRILGDSHSELERLGDAFRNLPEWRPQVGRRADELKAALGRAALEHDDLRHAIEAALQAFNGRLGADESWRKLDALIQDQYWRAAYFRVAADDINYRRFFNINDLAGLRMELPDVFEQAHSLIFRFLEEGAIDGLRIDHVDGLLDPKEYFERLRAATPAPASERFYIVVEKILSREERLREDWPIDGTTGYDFTNLVLGLLIDPAGEQEFTETYAAFTGERKPFREIVRECKLRIMKSEMASELNALAREAVRVAHQNPATADFTQNSLRRAIRELVACFPVYRTYIDTEGKPTEADRHALDLAMRQARANETDLDASVFDFIYKLASGDLVSQGRSGFSRHAVLRWAMRLQQFSGPVMAKGLEDTAFYRYNRFVALNEVGGDPEHFGVSIASFHEANEQRAKRWPDSMLGTSTHDTKHGEDARARLAVLSEMPDEWAQHVQAWTRSLRDTEGLLPLDPSDEYLLYQLLIGTWPVELTGQENPDQRLVEAYKARLKTAMTKSVREAKVQSTWAWPNAEYEQAVLMFIGHALNFEKSRAFFKSFLPFQERVARLGVRNSLVQTALKLTAPGVPDIYQGADLWDLSLVDPDNRRPVDYTQRIRLLNELDAAGEDVPVRELLADWRNGAIKLLVISKLLRFRAAKPDLFARGAYEAVLATGPKQDLICAFSRKNQSDFVVVVSARFPARLEADPGWAGAVIPLPSRLRRSALRDVLTGKQMKGVGEELLAEAVLAELPVAVLAPVRAHI